MTEIILRRAGAGRPKGSKMPKVYKATHVPIHISYQKEYEERKEELILETETEMRKRLFE